MCISPDKNYLRFDEKSNTYDSLKKLILFLSQTGNDPSFWKWVILALHNGLYGVMILSLKGTMDNSPNIVENIINKKTKKERARLIGFQEAFKRIQNKNNNGEYKNYMERLGTSKVFKTKEHHERAVEWINDELRNQFIHFKPTAWSIRIDDIKETVNACMEIVEFCIFQSGNVSLSDDEKQEFESALFKIKNHNALI